jgi:hypothetical protein
VHALTSDAQDMDMACCLVLRMLLQHMQQLIQKIVDITLLESMDMEKMEGSISFLYVSYLAAMNVPGQTCARLSISLCLCLSPCLYPSSAASVLQASVCDGGVKRRTIAPRWRQTGRQACRQACVHATTILVADYVDGCMPLCAYACQNMP